MEQRAVRRSRGRDGREPDDGNSRNAAHLGEISSNEGVEKMEELEVDLETLGGEVRREDARAKRAQLSATMAMAFPPSESRARERERVDECWRVRGVVASMTASMT